MKRLFVVMMLVGCASTPAPNLIEADAKMVEQCQFIGDVVGTSKLGIALQEHSQQAARDKMMRKAADMGATHVVIQSIAPATMGGGASAHAKAYRCPVQGR